MVVGAAGGERVAALGELGSEVLRVLLHLLDVLLELGRRDLVQLRRDGRDLVHVGAALQPGEDGGVDLLLALGPALLVDEDHGAAGTAQGLVRRRRHNVGVLEGVVVLAGGDEATVVGHVHEEAGVDGIGDRTVARVIPVTGVRGAAGDDHLRHEELRLGLKRLEVDRARLCVETVRQRLEVHGRRGDLARGGVEAVREVAAVGEVEAHQAVVWVQQRRVRGEVGGRAAVGLDVDGPGVLLEAEGLERAVAAEVLHLVHDLVAAVVPLAGVALGVLVRADGAEARQHGAGREVLGGDELEAADLALELLLQEAVHHGVGVLDVTVAREAAGHGTTKHFVFSF
eukprot:PhM_4_TR4514/c0_g1_i1/m.58683